MLSLPFVPLDHVGAVISHSGGTNVQSLDVLDFVGLFGWVLAASGFDGFTSIEQILVRLCSIAVCDWIFVINSQYE